MKFIKPKSEELGGSWLVSDKNDLINIAYKKANCQGYLLEMNAYEKLVYLTGYDIIEDVENSKASFSTIQDKISKKYGKEKCEDFLRTMNDWYVEYNNNWMGDEVYNLSIKLEELFLEFVKQDINNIQSQNEAINYTKKFEFYKTKNLPEIYETTSNNIITNKVLKIDDLDISLKKLNSTLTRVFEESR